MHIKNGIEKFKKIMSESESRKKKVAISIGIIILSIVLMITAFIISKTNRFNKGEIIDDPELARAMTYGELTEEDENTNSEYVKFSAFFLRDLNKDGYAQKIKGTCKQVGQTDPLYMSINVLTDGMLKDGKIQIVSKNMYFQTALVKDDVIQDNYISNNTKEIYLNDISVGTQKLIIGNVISGNYSYATALAEAIGKNVNNYSAINKIIFTGTHVDSTGKETKIEKEIELPVDWYEKVVAELPETYIGGKENKYQGYNLDQIISDDVIKLKFKIVSQEISDKLLLKKSYIEGEIPELNGYSPIDVKVTGKNIEYTYDESTRKFTAYREAKIDADGNILVEANSGIWNTNRYNEYNLEVEYPVEAYNTIDDSITLKIPVKAYYEGFNNTNEEFSNPYVSNIAEDIFLITYTKTGGDVVACSPTIGTYVNPPYGKYVVSKKTAMQRYDDIESSDIEEYEVKWNVCRGDSGTVTQLNMFEPEGQENYFIKTDGTTESLSGMLTNKGVYFENAEIALSVGGKLRLMNADTNEVLMAFDKDNIGEYTAENPYLFTSEVNRIRVEIENLKMGTNCKVVQIKEIDNNKLVEKFTKEEFRNFKFIAATLGKEVKYENTDEFETVNSEVAEAQYDAPVSIATITTLNPNYITTRETTKNMKIVLTTTNLNYNVEAWKNGVFLVKFPSEILLAEINNIKVSDSNVRILGYDLFKEGDSYFLKIVTENDEPMHYSITIDCDVTPDSRKLTVRKKIEMYAYNEVCDEYKDGNKSEDIYDIDSDANVDEKVNYATNWINIIGPSSLITTETASDYDYLENEVRTAVAPQVAIIDKQADDKTAKVTVQINNNYSGTISGVRILGKIPTEKNTFVLNQRELGSMYSTTMMGKIEVPEELKDITKVYYSVKENPTNDLADVNNEWTSTVTDWAKVKSYLIDLGDYKLEKSTECNFAYKIQIPDTVKYNDIAYSTHAVYFYLETDEGKLADKTGTSKLGFMIAKKYDLELSKVEKGNGRSVSGAFYSIQESGKENAKIVSTDTNGKLLVKDLYVDKEYTIKELKAPSKYVLNEDEIRIKAVEEDGQVKIKNIGTNEELTTETRERGTTVILQVEDEPRYNFVINKTDKKDNTPISGIRFRIKGKGFSSDGKVLRTNTAGVASTGGLYPGETYTLVEEYAEGYKYNENEFKFRVVWNGNDLVAEILDGDLTDKLNLVNVENDVPTVTVNIQNEKLKEYSFELYKFEKDTDTMLAGAKFRLTGKWMDEEITTNENGYLKAESKLYDGIEYTLEEVMAPDGYALSNNVIKFRAEYDSEADEWKMVILEGELEDRPLQQHELIKLQKIVDKDGNEITDKMASMGYGSYTGYASFLLCFADEPLFKLTKIDGTTQESLPGAKFTIKKVNYDKSEEIAKDVDGNVVGKEEILDGEKCYVVETNEKGEIKANLPEGLYKVVEVEAPEGYEFAENVEDRTYYFGIGKAKPAEKEISEKKSFRFGNKGLITYQDILKTFDGGYVILAGVNGECVISANETVSGKEIILSDNSSVLRNDEGILVLIKYNKDEKVEWATKTTLNSLYRMKVVQSENGNYYILSSNGIAKIDVSGNFINKKFSGIFSEYDIIATSDGGYVFCGNCGSSGNFKINAGDTVNNQEINYKNTQKINSVAIAVKVNSDDKVEWVNILENQSTYNQIIENDNGEFIVIGSTGKGKLPSSLMEDNTELELIESYTTIRLSDSGKIIEVKNPGQTLNGIRTYKTSDNGIILANNYNLIKLNSIGDIEWEKPHAQTITHKKLIEVSDGYVDFGCYVGNYKEKAENTVDNKSININGVDGQEGIVIKYNQKGLIEWIKILKGSGNDCIVSGIEMSNNELLILGNSESDSVIESMDNTIEGNTIGAIKFDITSEATVKNVENKIGCIESFSAMAKAENGVVIVGKFKGRLIFDENNTIDGRRIEIDSVGKWDSIILKINDEQKIEWVNTFGNSYDNVLNDVIKNGENYVAVGSSAGNLTISSDRTKDGNEFVFNGAGTRGTIIVFDENGKIVDADVCDGKGSNFTTVSEVKNGKYYIGAVVNGSLSLDGLSMETNSNQEQTILQMNDRNELESITDLYYWGQTINDIKIMQDDGIVVASVIFSKMFTIPGSATTFGEITLGHTEANNDAIIVRLNSDMKIEYIKDIKPIDGASWDECKDVVETEDGGFAVLWNGYLANGIQFGPDETADGKTIKVTNGGWCSYIIKYNADNKVQKLIFRSKDTPKLLNTADEGYITASSANDKTNNKLVRYNKRFERECLQKTDMKFKDILELESGKYIAVGNMSPDSLEQEILVFSESTISAEIPDQQTISVTNEKKKFEITTEVKEHDGIKGGTISGENDEPYEIVKYGEDSTKGIKIIPDENYNILKITVNDEEIEFVPNEDGSVTLDKFTNMTNDVHIVVEFSNAVSDVIVHHYKVGTEESVSPDESLHGEIGSSYVTSPKLDIDGYEVMQDVIPENASGKFSKEVQEVVYYYKEKPVRFVVHHYLEGTSEIVPESDDEQIDEERERNTAYTTKALENLNEKYELVEEPENASGVLDKDETVVVYYYKIKIRNVTTTVQRHEEINELGEVTEVAGGVITGEDETDFEDVEYGEDSQKEITVTADEGYQIKSLKIETIFEDESITVEDVKIIGKMTNYTVAKFTNMRANKRVIVEFERVIGQVIVHHYIENTTIPVEVADGIVAEDEVKNGTEGTNYATKPKENLVGYEYVSSTDNTSGKYIDGAIEVIYYYRALKYKYFVNYYEKDTNNLIANQKVADEIPYKTMISSSDEIIDIDGYVYDSADKESLLVRENEAENVINIYYTKRNDLSYKVNYLEKDTNKVIHDQKVVENVTFEDEITSANEVITIYGYNYDSVDKDILKISTGENVINIYYTKKDAKVTVHYYEENTTNKVSEDKEITGKVNDEYTTAIADDIPSKYELVATPANATGTMTEDAIEVIYYFRKKATQVIVRHYEEGTTVKLSEDVTIEGRIDDPYTTVAATDVPIKYELSVTPANANGTMTEDTIEVIYYYRVKDAVLNIRYLEKGTEKELAQPEQQHGKVDEEYITGAKTIDGYTLVEHSGNERGKFEVNPLTVTYYYLYNTRATVQYIDKITGQILEQSTTEGLEGDDFVTESKSFDNYILVEEPVQKTVKMTKDEIVLKYYYIHVSGGVIEKHIDVISGEVLDNKTYEGNEGDTYNIPSRTFQGYDLVEDRLPANAQGTMTVNPIEVVYYYIYKSKVTAQYVDKNTGEKLTEDEVQNGHEKDAYVTDRKTFDDYKLVEVPANADGEMTKKDITVTYNYVHTSGGVIVNHIDINTGKQLLDETKQEGYEGDPYETHEENIPGYTLVKEKYPANAQGTMTREETRVTYYYVKNTEVNIKYIDKETGEEIIEKTNIPGKEGDNYTTEPKDIPGYDLVEEPANKDGTMKAEPIEVIYYYRRPAKVITRYIDQETNEEIATEEKQEGHQNDEYTTEAKDIKYYKLIATPDNATGTMKVTVTKDEHGKDIVEDTIYVTYYYRKLIFNLNIDKKVSSVTVNGEESIINGDLGKVEVHRKELNTAKVEVKYIIKVTNDSELTGKASILEDIPTGMIMNAEKNAGWEVKETTATREIKELQPGESEEYLVVLDWENGENNIGMKENTASIISIENEAGFEEKDTTDNEDKADVIVAIGTGGHTYVLIAGVMLLILISLACGVYIIKKND